METLATLGLIALVMMGMTLVIVPLIALPLCGSQEEVRGVLKFIMRALMAELVFPVSFPLLGIWALVRWYYKLPDKVEIPTKSYYW